MNVDMSGFNNPSLYDAYGNAMGATGQDRLVSLEDDADVNMGQLVRRNPNQQLAPAPRRTQWDGFPSPTQQWETMDDEEELEQKAAVAKKDAQSKRKQIPPFVQKLSRCVKPIIFQLCCLASQFTNIFGIVSWTTIRTRISSAGQMTVVPSSS